jgi:hypothetical protein
MPTAPLVSLPAEDRASATKPKRQPRASKRITMCQASNMMAAVRFARQIGTPLLAHATIHWAGTYAGDDPEGWHFAKVREGFDKWLRRRGVPGGLTAIWSRERLSGGSADVVHCHMLFHLPPALHLGKNYVQVDTALRRLVERHGNSIYGDFAVDLRTHPDPDGRYLIKGGGRDVWEQFRIRKE